MERHSEEYNNLVAEFGKLSKKNKFYFIMNELDILFKGGDLDELEAEMTALLLKIPNTKHSNNLEYGRE